MTQKIVHADIEGFAARLVLALQKGEIIQREPDDSLKHTDLVVRTWKGKECQVCTPFREVDLDLDHQTAALLDTMNRWQAAHNKLMAVLADELKKIADEKEGNRGDNERA